MKTITCIEDMRQAARRKVPRAFFEYADGGSYAEETLRANRADLERIKLRQRIMVDVADRSTNTTILGEPASLPLALAPIGLCGMQHGDGEILACRAAQAAGIPFCLSTMSICSIEDVAGAVDKPFWFQLYVMKDRGFIRSLIERAAAAKCSALVLTVDLQILGQRHRDIKNGMTVPPELRIKNFIDIATKPAWALSVLRGKRKTFGNIAGHIKGMESVNVLSQWISGQFDPSLNWKDIEWINEPLAGQAHPQGHPRRRRCAHRGKDRRRGAGRVQSWRPPARRRAVVDLRAAKDRRRARLGHRDHVRRRHPLRPGPVPRACARRARLPERPGLHLRAWRRRAGRRRTRHRDHPQRARRHHGADRRQKYRARSTGAPSPACSEGVSAEPRRPYRH